MTTTQGAKYQLMPEMTPEQYTELKDDIRQKGMLQPVEYDTDGNIIDGHHRVRAFFELIEEGVDLPMFDRVTRTFASEDDKLDYVVSFNVKRRQLTSEQRAELVAKLKARGMTMTRIAQTLSVNVATVSRDFASLPQTVRDELAAIPAVSSNGKVFSGSYAPRIISTGEQVLKQFNTSVTPSPAVAAPANDRAEELLKKWRVEPGQLWDIPSKEQPGRSHRLLCGNSSEPYDVDMVMQGDYARLVVTSPPYNQMLDKFKPSGMQNENPSFVHRMASSYGDSMPEADYQEWQESVIDMLYDYTTDDASFLYNHKHRYREMLVVSPLEWINKTRWSLRQEIVWDRGSSITMNARMFIPADERIYWLFKGHEFFFSDTPEVKAWSSVWRIAARNEENVSAPFPNELAHRAIVACSERGDVVLEPYAGTGTTIAESERAGRLCYGIEISPKYCAVILERLTNMGLAPALAG